MARRRIYLMGGGLLGVLLVVWVVFQALPDLFAQEQSRGFGLESEVEARNAVRSAALQLLGGLVLAVGGYFTARNYHLTRQRDEHQREASEARIRLDREANEARFRIEREGQITERFTRAIDHLGHAELDVRLGGIYALERIARDSPVDHGPIIEVLTAYVREHAPWPPVPASAARDGQPAALDDGLPGADGSSEALPAGESAKTVTPATDVQAVLTVLGRRRREHDPDGLRIHLRSVDLRGADLEGAQLNGADLAGAHLEGAILADAQLEGAYGPSAHLEDAYLPGARLAPAYLENAHMARAHLRGAHLDMAYMWEADLRDADLENAGLERTNLGRACLINATLARARLDGAHLDGAHLERAYLWDAQLEGADLSGAHLEGADLRAQHLEGANLKGALFDVSTRWPNGFDPSAAGARRSDRPAGVGPAQGETPVPRPMPAPRPPHPGL